MSELTKLCNQLSSLETRAIQLAETHWEDADIVLLRQQVQDIETTLSLLKSSLLPSAEKFLAKKNFVDPVTGASRFGPTQCTRIDNAHVSAVALVERFEGMKAGIAPVLEGREAVERAAAAEAERIIQEERAKEAARVQAEALEKQRQALLQENVFVSSELTAQELHEKAERLRLQKAQDLADRQQLMEQAEACLKSLVNDLNNRVKGRTTVTQTILQTDTFARSSGSWDARCTAMTTLKNILANIIAHPDNETLRKLRVDHPVLWEKLTGVPEFLLVLLAMGFELRLELTGTVTMPAALSTARSDMDKIPTDPSTAHQVLDLCRLSGCKWRAVLVLVEPDTSNSSLWIQWFDSLSDYKTMLDAA